METTMKDVNVKLIGLEIEAREKSLTLIDAIITTVGKFDGKQANKRLDTALKAIDESLRFDMEYNSFRISMYIRNRSFEENGHAHYIKESQLYLVHGSIRSAYGDAIMPNGVIDGKELTAQLETYRKSTLVHIAALRNQLANIDAILAEYKAIKATMEKFLDGTSWMIRNYFELKP